MENLPNCPNCGDTMQFVTRQENYRCVNIRCDLSHQICSVCGDCISPSGDCSCDEKYPRCKERA